MKPSAKSLRMYRIFIGCKRRYYVIADGALKLMQVHTWTF